MPKFSETDGTVLEVRQITKVSDGDGLVAGRLTSNIYNKIRVKWDRGDEGFFNTSLDFSAGDRVRVFNSDKKVVSWANLNTKEYTKPNWKPWPKYTFLFSIFIVMLIIVVAWNIQRSEDFYAVYSELSRDERIAHNQGTRPIIALQFILGGLVLLTPIAAVTVGSRRYGAVVKHIVERLNH